MTTGEAVLLLAAKQKRLRRFVYRSGEDHTDAVISAGFGGGGKANPKMLAHLVEQEWLIEPVMVPGEVEGCWTVTDAGWGARAAFLANPKRSNAVRYGRRVVKPEGSDGV